MHVVTYPATSKFLQLHANIGSSIGLSIHRVDARDNYRPFNWLQEDRIEGWGHDPNNTSEWGTLLDRYSCQTIRMLCEKTLPAFYSNLVGTTNNSLKTPNHNYCTDSKKVIYTEAACTLLSNRISSHVRLYYKQVCSHICSSSNRRAT